jgi:aquaporin Z
VGDRVGVDSFDASTSGCQQRYGDHSPGGYSLLACLVTEVVLTAFFL